MTNPFASLATAAVNGLSPYEPGMPVEELERRYGIRDAIKLASNENPYPVPASVLAAMQSAVADAGRYPDGAGFALRAALARHLGVAPEQLTLGNGSNDVLVLLAETFLSADVTAIYDQYSFVVYRLAVQGTGAGACVVPSNPVNHPQPLGHDLAAMQAAVDASTRLVFIANPNNPTGSWVPATELHSFIAGLPAHVIAVVDEAYFEYASGDSNALDWLDEFPNLVVVRTFSKAYGLAALRIGYAISSPDIAELLNRVRQPFNCNTVAQQAAVAALQEQAWVAECRERNAEAMAALIAGLDALGIASIPSRGNFVLARFGDQAAAWHEGLLQRGVIVRPVANYGLPEYLRITVGSQSEIDRLLLALSDIGRQTT